MDAQAVPELVTWARRRGQCVTAFDLETTQQIPHASYIGIIEVALLSVTPSGALETESGLVNPERRIPKEVTALTGIRTEDVSDQPTWATWAQRLHQLARDHVMIGYNSSGFDCPVVVGQNARYGVLDTSFLHSLDAMALPGVRGTLSEAAAAHGLASEVVHRAAADAWLTARLVNAVAALRGLDVLDQHVGAGGQCSPRAARESELVAAYEESGALPALDAFAERHGIKRSTAEGDVLRLVESGLLPEETIAVTVVQDWLANHLPQAIARCWGNSSEQRLKPLMEHLHSMSPPTALDYTQLRLGLRRLGATTTSEH